MDELLSALNENIHKEDCQIRMGVIFIIIALILCSLTDVMGSQSWEKVMIQNADGFQKAPIIGKAACSIGTGLPKGLSNRSEIKRTKRQEVISDVCSDDEASAPVIKVSVPVKPSSNVGNLSEQPAVQEVSETNVGIFDNRDQITVPDCEEAGISISDDAEINEIKGFLIDMEGYITGYTDRLEIEDGLIVFPIDESCIGVRAESLYGLDDQVMEIYIPENIIDIESGAFDHLTNLIYIEVAAENPVYMSDSGVLYTREGEVVACPRGR